MARAGNLIRVSVCQRDVMPMKSKTLLISWNAIHRHCIRCRLESLWFLLVNLWSSNHVRCYGIHRKLLILVLIMWTV